MTSPLPIRLLAGRRGINSVLGRGVELLSMDVFGLALEPTFLEPDHQHLLIGTIVARHFTELDGVYQELRVEAERRARAATTTGDTTEVSLAMIGDHLAELLGDEFGDTSFDPARAARYAVETEVDLRRALGRPNPDALELHMLARERRIPTALIADSHLPRDLIAEIARNSGYTPDHVLVSSNEGHRKDSGLYERLLSKAGVPAEAVLHLGPDQLLDVDLPAQLGITGQLSPTSANSDNGPDLVIGLNRPRGLGSIVLGHAGRHLSRSGRSANAGFDVGYYAAGPLLVGFSVWLRSVLCDISPDHVLFCGTTGSLLDEALSIIDDGEVGTARRHVLAPSADDPYPVARLAATVPLADAERIVVVDLGLFDAPHDHVASTLDRGGDGPAVIGAYLGRPEPGETGMRSWAFSEGPDCPVRSIVMQRPEIVEAMLRRLPSSVQDVPPALRPYHATGREVGKGALTFVDDVEPWLHLDEASLSVAMVEPALRVIAEPTPDEARVFGTYLVHDPLRPSAGQMPLAPPPPRGLLPVRATTGDSAAAVAPWAEGQRVLARGKGPSPRRALDSLRRP